MYKEKYSYRMLVRESISFERGLGPKRAMGLGIAGQIEEYSKDLSDWEVVGTIVEDPEIPVDTKKSWINHLLKTNPEKYDFDENAMYWFDDNNFDYLTPLPDGHSWPINTDMDLGKVDGQWIVAFDDWANWSNLFISNNRVSKEFVEAVLGGDAYQFFESSDSLPLYDKMEFISQNLKEIPVWSYLEDLYIELGGEEDRGNIKEEIKNIYSQEEFEDLKNSIDRAFMDADESARENEAFKDLKKTIVDHYELGTEMYDDHSNTYKVNTTIIGADKLAKAATLGSDYYIDYFPARDDYWAPIDLEYFNEVLQNHLENLSR